MSQVRDHWRRRVNPVAAFALPPRSFFSALISRPGRNGSARPFRRGGLRCIPMGLHLRIPLLCMSHHHSLLNNKRQVKIHNAAASLLIHGRLLGGIRSIFHFPATFPFDYVQCRLLGFRRRFRIFPRATKPAAKIMKFVIG